MKDRIKHFEYWVGWLMVTLSGMGIRLIIDGQFTLWTLLLYIPLTITGFYITVIKDFSTIKSNGREVDNEKNI